MWFVVMLLGVVALILGVLGFLAMIDPEGRGYKLAGWFYAACVLCLLVAGWLVVKLLGAAG
jgi:hypothetical protein